MNKFELLAITERIQMEADEMAYQLVKAGQLARIQSICLFNIFWISELSRIICTEKTLEFLDENKKEFKRKLTLKEFFNIDLLVNNFQYETFPQFKKAFKAITSEPNLILNVKLKI